MTCEWKSYSLSVGVDPLYGWCAKHSAYKGVVALSVTLTVYGYALSGPPYSGPSAETPLQLPEVRGTKTAQSPARVSL